jgi:hypothetical protein
MLLLNNGEARSRLIEELRPLEVWRTSAMAQIYTAAIGMFDAGEEITFHALHARLGAADQDRLAALVLEPAAGNTFVTEDGAACIESMRREEREARQRDLKARIKAAEREGSLEHAFRLMKELQNL